MAVMTKKRVERVVKKEVSSAKNIANRAKAKNLAQDKEIAALRAELDKLKARKTAKRSMTEYNIFIRKQIRSGMTFIKAAKQWSKYKKLQEQDKRRPSAYNQFIGSQMRLGKTWDQSVALWKLAKAGKLGKKGTTRTVTKTVVRRVKSKPQVKYRTRTITSKPKIKYRTRTKTVVKRVKSKPTVVTKVRYRTKKTPVKTVTRVVRQNTGIDAAALKSLISSSLASSRTVTTTTNGADDDEVAFRIVQTYFKEVARYGMKKQLSLDEIINAYFYALARVKRKEASYDVDKSMRETGMKK